MLNRIKKDRYPILIAVLMLLGLILRICKLSSQSLWIDEGFTINAALQTLKHGFPLLESGFTYTGSLFHTYLISFFMLFSQDPIFPARLVSVIFGIFTIPLIYYLGKEIWNKKIGLITAILVTFSVWEIAWSRQARLYTQLQFFYLLSLLMFYKLLQNKTFKYLILTSLFTLVAILTHSLGFSLLLIFAIYLFVNYEDLKQLLGKVKSSLTRKHKLILCILLALSIILVSYLIFKTIKYYNYTFINYFTPYLYYIRFSHVQFFYAGLIGMLVSLREFKKSSLLILSYFIPFLVISFAVYLLHYRYLFFILPILFIFTSYLIYKISIYFRKYSLLAGVILLALIIINGFIFIPKEQYSLETFTPQPDFKSAYEYVKANMQEDDVIIDAYPALGKIYLGKVDYGLKFSLTGREVDILNQTHDIYTGVPFIDEITFKNLNNCWIIADELALSRISEEIKSNLKFVRYNASGVKIYECNS